MQLQIIDKVMKILNADKIHEADAFTIANEPISSIDLMERASSKLFNWITDHFPKDVKFLIVAGPGNNGGDGLALARLLYENLYREIKVVVCEVSSSFSKDFIINRDRLQNSTDVNISILKEGYEFPAIDSDFVVVDALFGSGLNRPVSGYWAKLIEHINTNASEVVAIDIPSGLFATNNSGNNGAIINANVTLTFEFPKLSFFFAENHRYTGHWKVLPIGLHPEFIEVVEASAYMLCAKRVKTYLPARNKFDHKGTFGHGFLVAGSYQKTGAAVLAAKAALRSGIGLLTVHVPQSGYEIMQTAVPEAMLFIDETEINYCNSEVIGKFSAVGTGPGIGIKKSIQNATHKLIQSGCGPMVIDADALNILSEDKDRLRDLPQNTILTPHPGEFDRLTKKHNSSEERVSTQREFAIKQQVIVILKGAHTSIATPNGELFFNNTGNPGMATAGSGDVLTGILLSLLAQGLTAARAAKLGVFIHGLAGDIAVSKTGEQGLIASDIIDNLGVAFEQLKRN